MRNILVTGGLGFIGSHTVISLVNNGFFVLMVDNLANSKIDVLDKMKKLLGMNGLNLRFIRGDIRDKELLKNCFEEFKIDIVIHFAGLKAVAESINQPIKYYSNNVVGTVTLLEVMKEVGCKKIVFSSSATVYGDQEYPVNEESKTGIGITNPYGRTKYMLEEILKDVYKSDPDWSVILLRYFNPVGAHPTGLLGEDPKDIPNNLFPYILGAAKGELEKLSIFGNDYDTEDGTCIRDFIHVCDLAVGHIYSLKKVDTPGTHIYNLGTGKGTSVKEFVETFETVTGQTINKEFVERRSGDLPTVYADVSKANKELNWRCSRTLEDVCRDGWNFISR